MYLKTVQIYQIPSNLRKLRNLLKLFKLAKLYDIAEAAKRPGQQTTELQGRRNGQKVFNRC